MADLEEELTKRFAERETALALLDGGFTHLQVAVALGVCEMTINAYAQGFVSQTAYRTYLVKRAGFKSRAAYQTHLARQRINPETGKPFKSRIDLRDNQVRRRGFVDFNEYLELIRDPTILIVDVLLQAGRPLSLPEIYQQIADKYSIQFTPERKKIEKTIERANSLATSRIFVDERGLWALDAGSPAIRELSLEGRAESVGD